LGGLLFFMRGINHGTIQLMQKQSQMKKFLFVAAIAAFAACNNSGSEAKTDSTSSKMADSSKMSADSSKMAADSSKMSADSSKMSADTSKMKK
jgi:hypothetical protein